jgi:hypothetical protein
LSRRIAGITTADDDDDIVAPDAGELAKLAGLVDAARLRAVVSQTFPVSDGRRAFESARAPRPPGKTVLIVR